MRLIEPPFWATWTQQRARGCDLFVDLPPPWRSGSLPGPTRCPSLGSGRHLAPEARSAWGALILGMPASCQSPIGTRLLLWNVPYMATPRPKGSSRCWPGSVSEGSLRDERVRSPRILERAICYRKSPLWSKHYPAPLPPDAVSPRGADAGSGS